MNKPEIAALLHEKYDSFITYINGLADDAYTYSNGEKWTPAQQLNHMVLCMQPLVQVMGMDAAMTEKTFGRRARTSRTYAALAGNYKEKLMAGGKAPGRYVPEPVPVMQRAELCAALAALVKELCARMDKFTEQDMDSLNIPHPLLGDLTMREMLYNTADHAAHHEAQTRKNLAGK